MSVERERELVRGAVMAAEQRRANTRAAVLDLCDGYRLALRELQGSQAAQIVERTLGASLDRAKVALELPEE